MKGYNRIHAYAQCRDCDWTYTDISGKKHRHDTGKKAQNHADKTGHRTFVEIAFTKDYQRRTD
jgi:hypothetical protein